MSSIAEQSTLDQAPARNLKLVTKHDSNANAFRALRVYVAAADAPATLKVLPAGGAAGVDEITLKYPAGVFWEPMAVKVVWATGSTANAEVHGVL